MLCISGAPRRCLRSRRTPIRALGCTPELGAIGRFSDLLARIRADLESRHPPGGSHSACPWMTPPFIASTMTRGETAAKPARKQPREFHNKVAVSRPRPLHCSAARSLKSDLHTLGEVPFEKLNSSTMRESCGFRQIIIAGV